MGEEGLTRGQGALGPGRLLSEEGAAVLMRSAHAAPWPIRASGGDSDVQALVRAASANPTLSGEGWGGGLRVVHMGFSAQCPGVPAAVTGGLPSPGDLAHLLRPLKLGSSPMTSRSPLHAGCFLFVSSRIYQVS